MRNNNFIIVKIVFSSFLFLIKLQYSYTGFSHFFSFEYENEINCSLVNLTNCSFCSPGTIYNNSTVTIANSASSFLI